MLRGIFFIGMTSNPVLLVCLARNQIAAARSDDEHCSSDCGYGIEFRLRQTNL